MRGLPEMFTLHKAIFLEIRRLPLFLTYSGLVFSVPRCCKLFTHFKDNDFYRPIFNNLVIRQSAVDSIRVRLIVSVFPSDKSKC